ncbi:PREDICTED: F-box DNA helicase 1-like, partial [Priapulus caudatus]|uniref:F-box DNA helicase 1-like n=1 Tax=Priapulus caudatus TaxID=37621 RepID=A0ABM1F1M0_PRICU
LLCSCDVALTPPSPRSRSRTDVILSTAHKAKGLEFVTVRLMDDFLAEAKNGIVSQHDANNGGHDYEFNLDFNEDEINLLYVAVTRAKRHLVMSPLLMTLLSQKCQEKFVYPVCTGIPREATRANATGSAVQGRSADLLAEALGRSPVKVAAVEAVAASTRDCCECKQQFTPRSVTFIRHTLRLFHGNTIEGGYMCKGCAGRRLHPSVLTLGGATVVQRAAARMTAVEY